MSRRSLGGQLFLLSVVIAACGKHSEKKPTFPFLTNLSPAPKVQTNLAQLQGDDGQWVMPAKNYQSTRFSGLNQINATNIAKKYDGLAFPPNSTQAGIKFESVFTWRDFS